MILAGLTMFAVASVGCAMADSPPELLAWRMLQAAGGAAGSVVVNARCATREGCVFPGHVLRHPGDDARPW